MLSIQLVLVKSLLTWSLLPPQTLGGQGPSLFCGFLCVAHCLKIKCLRKHCNKNWIFFVKYPPSSLKVSFSRLLVEQYSREQMPTKTVALSGSTRGAGWSREGLPFLTASCASRWRRTQSLPLDSDVRKAPGFNSEHRNMSLDCLRFQERFFRNHRWIGLWLCNTLKIWSTKHLKHSQQPNSAPETQLYTCLHGYASLHRPWQPPLSHRKAIQRDLTGPNSMMRSSLKF